MASSAGGMDIEKVAEETPELILKETIDPAVGLRGFQARKLAFGLGIPNDLINQAAKFMLYALRGVRKDRTPRWSRSIRSC